MTYRLGIDVGTNSIGWCLLDLNRDGEPTGIRDIGVRIFHDSRDPQSGTSLAVDRRTARGMRRRRDRYLLRRQDLMDALIRMRLMPKDEAARKALERIDPYELRKQGLDERLGLHQLGRAIFHLNQRRGFRSNRKTDKADADAKESGKIKIAADKLTTAMAESGARTLGEFLARRHRKRRPVRTRLSGEGAKAEYDFYPQRAMLEEEFAKLWEAQEQFHPELTPEKRDALHGILFRQRPLRPVDPGKCALDPAKDKDDAGGFRAPWALPLTQRFRIYQELANLRLIRSDYSEQVLDHDQRETLAKELGRKNKVTFKAMRRKLRLSEGFNLESERRDHLKGDETAVVLSKKDRFGPRWHELGDEEQSEIVERLLAEEDEEALVAWLTGSWDLDSDSAQAVVEARLPEGYCRLGRRALGRIVPIMRDQGLVYADAAEEAGYHHSDRRPDEVLDRLPYYGEALERHVSGSGDPEHTVEKKFGHIANPTVHVGLNQLRRLVNSVAERHGAPAEIVVELARELKQSRDQKKRIQKDQAENQRKNDLRRAKLAEIGELDSGGNRMKLRLWEELNPGDPLDRRCVYTGEQISVRKLFSPEVEIDHILPFSKTLDNSAANRTVSMRYANRAKGNRSPHAAFGHGPRIDGKSYDWTGILLCSQALPKNKSWRFGSDAMDRFETEEKDFLDRQLTDTAYFSKVTRQYLTHICPAEKVWVIPGRLTAMLRGKWGLNSLLSDANLKNRVDHRHHAIDAVVAALTARGMLQKIARAAEDSRERLIDDMPDPWTGFRDELREALNRIVVSQKPDHGIQGKLHEETAYGLIKNPAREDGFNLVYRKPFADLNTNEIARIRDSVLRARVTEFVSKELPKNERKGPKLKQALTGFASDNGIRRVRLLKKEKADVIPIAGPDGVPFKAYIPGNNHHIDIFELPGGNWDGEGVTVFQANQKGYAPHWPQEYPGARLVMRVHKGDLLKLEHNGSEEVMRVVKLEVSAKRLCLAGDHEGGNLQKRHDDKDDPFRWLFASFNTVMREGRARRVGVDVMGRVRDPGPHS